MKSNHLKYRKRLSTSSYGDVRQAENAAADKRENLQNHELDFDRETLKERDD